MTLLPVMALWVSDQPTLPSLLTALTFTAYWVWASSPFRWYTSSPEVLVSRVNYICRKGESHLQVPE